MKYICEARKSEIGKEKKNVSMCLDYDLHKDIYLINSAIIYMENFVSSFCDINIIEVVQNLRKLCKILDGVLVLQDTEKTLATVDISFK